MGSQNKSVREEQKAAGEKRLAARLAALRERGADEKEIAKDVHVRSLKSKVRESGARLKAIDAVEKRTAELAKVKADRAAAPKPDKAAKKEAEPVPEVKPKKEKKKKDKEPAA